MAIDIRDEQSIAVAKLYYLFSCGYTKEEINAEMEKDLRGELTLN